MNSISTHKMKNRSLSFFLLFFIILLFPLTVNAHEFSTYTQPHNFSVSPYAVNGLYVNNSNIIFSSDNNNNVCGGSGRTYTFNKSYSILNNVSYNGNFDWAFRGFTFNETNFLLIGDWSDSGFCDTPSDQIQIVTLSGGTSYLDDGYTHTSGVALNNNVIDGIVVSGYIYVALSDGTIIRFLEGETVTENTYSIGFNIRNLAYNSPYFYAQKTNNDILKMNSTFSIIDTLVLPVNVSLTAMSFNNNTWFGLLSSSSQLYLFNELIPGDIIPPVFTQTPSDQSTFNNTLPTRDINATDNVLLDVFSLNNSIEFNISPITGIIGVITRLPGNYSLNVTVNDSSNNKATAVFNWEIKNFIIPPEPTPSEIADGLTSFWTNFAITFGLIVIILGLILSASTLLKRK